MFILTIHDPAPDSQEGGSDGAGGVGDGKEDHAGGLGLRDLAPSNAIDNHIVAVIPDEDDQPERSTAWTVEIH